MRYSLRSESALQLLNLISLVAAAFPNRPRDTTFAAAQNQTYDYVIVGGGITGLVAANRLSEDPTKSVIVLEHGYVDNSPATYIPYLATILNVADLYDLYSAPEPYLLNMSYLVTVGNVVGGGSIVNGMVYDRGSAPDYDAWEELGNDGWGWEDLKPYFYKSNHYTAPSESTTKEFNISYDAAAYGNGPVQVSIPSYQYLDYKTIFNSMFAENVTFPVDPMVNPMGAYWGPNDIDNATATRSNAHVTYYVPVASRPNLTLLPATKVNQILFSQDLTATGVQIVSRADGSVSEVFARKEVILAAGGVFTPHLLMNSGIGPKDVLTAANVTVKRDTPAVGSNFQDHYPLYMTYNLSNTAFPNPLTIGSNASFNASAYAQYEADRQGPYSLGRGNAFAFLSFQRFSTKYQSITASLAAQNPLDYLPPRYASTPALLAGFKKQRDILINRFLGDDAAVGEIPIQPWGHTTVALEKPLSRGHITLNTTDPTALPIVQWNALQNPIDGQILSELVRWNRVHWSRPELAGYDPVELLPGAQYTTDEDIIYHSTLSGALEPSYAHPSGSCAMMPEELGGCVSDQLLVYGTQRLSVIDASIIPLIPATHLQATMYAVAEKASDIIKGRG